LQLVTVEQGKVEMAFASRGMQDTYAVEPMMFVGTDRVLIVADTATEYSWGLVAFEFRGGQLRDLGELDVARRGSDEPFELENPLPFATARIANGEYEVSFATDLVLHPGGVDERRLPVRDGRAHVFRHSAAGWNLLAED